MLVMIIDGHNDDEMMIGNAGGDRSMVKIIK
jgi:hypothetical protein